MWEKGGASHKGKGANELLEDFDTGRYYHYFARVTTMEAVTVVKGAKEMDNTCPYCMYIALVPSRHTQHALCTAVSLTQVVVGHFGRVV